ncbi:universal stress protein [Nonomuraea angiospora]|uniref:universal stress protein n=1 Tax=Nonomuraea angiospora TaxID=46172 RepID=UPI0034365132
MGTRSRAVVVGVDGSRTAWSALAWAADDAGRRELPLRIVHVREPWLTEHPLSASSDKETLTERCDRLLANAADRAHELAPGVRTSTALVIGAVIERLRSESETADTVVVGYDASPCADMALEYALAQAVARRARLPGERGRRAEETVMTVSGGPSAAPCRRRRGAWGRA